MLLEVSAIISCLILACSGLEIATSCPECPHNTLDCHQPFHFGEPCPCSGCLTRCSIRDPICPKGEVCVSEDVHFGDSYVGQTAVCTRFEQCPQIQCPVGCPESGYFVDINDCATCLCIDPCKELKCIRGCGMWSVNPGTEPNYRCN